MMKREVFNLGIAALLNAFPYMADKMTKESDEIYWNDLKDVSDKRFEAAVDWCRHHLDFFPTIHQLGAACFNGSDDWHETIVKQKRLEFERKAKALAPPETTAEQRRANQGKLMELVKSVAKK